MRFLCLSDIHGHAHALSAVLATAERRGYSRVLVAGDLCFPGPEPLLTWQRLTQIGAICVQGVGDRALATIDAQGLVPRGDQERARLARLIEVRSELGDHLLQCLAKLPQRVWQPIGGGKQLLMVHGCPADPLESMTQDMGDEALAGMLGDEPADVVLCGGSHVPFDRAVERTTTTTTTGMGVGVPATTRVINLGSVGEAPMAGSSPDGRFAHATFVESTDDGIEVEQFVVPIGRAA